MTNPEDDLIPLHLVIELPNLGKIEKDLLEKHGQEFEKAVCQAMQSLDLDASLTATTEAESDVIVEAHHAEIPYFFVVECQAVREGGQVGVEKVGQIRGNASSYLDTRRQQLFEKYYKLIVGRPAFSDLAKERAEPDVGLLSVQTLVRLLKLHRKYHLSQDLLHEIFKKIGEINTESVNQFVRNFLRGEDRYFRRLEIYSLIYLAMLENPFSDKAEKRKKWTSLDQIVGVVLTYSKLFRIPDLTDLEVVMLIRDLDNPFMRIIESRRNQMRLSTMSLTAIENFSPLGEDLVFEIRKNLEKLRGLKL